MKDYEKYRDNLTEAMEEAQNARKETHLEACRYPAFRS